MKIGKLAIIGILFLMVCNGVNAVWIYPDVDMVANNFTLNTITAQNYTSVTYGDTWIDISEGGNITFAGNITSSRSLIELNGLCSIGNYTTDISIDIYAPPADWTVGSASLTCISNNSKADTPVTDYSATDYNATHQRVTFTYDPSNSFDTIDMGYFDANISVTAYNYTLTYSGYNISEDLFEVYHLASVGNITSTYNSTYDSINMSWNSVTENATTFRPNASGSFTECTPFGAANNWQCVNDTVQDGDTTYVYWETGFPAYDLYNIQNHTTETGTIEKATTYICSRKDGSNMYSISKITKTHGTMYSYSNYNTDDYETYSKTFETNPYTSNTWTWDEIDDLEIGIELVAGYLTYPHVTQMYVVVNWYEYTQGAIDEADSFVVVRSNTSQPVCPTEGYEVQNSTSIYYNVSRTFTEAYFTVFTYNSTTNSYGTGVPMLWGGIQLQCFNESNPSQAINFDIEITNSDASEVYTANDVSNGQAISFDDIPYGIGTIFVVSNSSYRQRISYLNIAVNHFYNYSFFLPPLGENDTEAKLYYIQIVDETSQPIDNARIDIKRYINTTDTYQNVSVLFTNGNGYASPTPYLIPNEHYKLFITKTGYDNGISDFIPDPDYYGVYYPEIIMIYASEPSYSNETTFEETITFEAYMNSAGTIFVNYSDFFEETITTNICIYENITLDVFHWDNRTGDNSFQFSVSGANTTMSYQVVLIVNHTIFGEHTLILFIIGEDIPDRAITTPTRFNTLFNANYGTSPGGFGWSNLFGFFIMLAGVFSLGQRDAGISMLVTGGLLLFVNSIIGLSVIGTVIPILFIVLGILVQWRNHRKEAAG